MGTKMEFPKDAIVDLIFSDEPYNYKGYPIEQVDIINHGTSRWESNHELIVSYRGNYYAYYYSKGLTEYQDHRSWDDEGEFIDLSEVIQIPVTTYKYELKHKPLAKTMGAYGEPPKPQWAAPANPNIKS